LEVFQYNAPLTKASPSLSVEGADDFSPKYISVKLSNDAAAEVALLAEAVAEVAEAVALVLASAAFVVAVAAAVVAVAASTNNVYLAELVLEVRGCDPEDVCAVFT
jgi:hypothetical protein